jgi:two-component system nitrogen regulation response regulator GlnG
MEVGDLGLPSVAASNVATPALTTLKEAEERHIRYVLERCSGNKTQACKVLGIGRATLYSKLGAE